MPLASTNFPEAAPALLIVFGETDKYSRRIAKRTFRHSGLDHRLTDVNGDVVKAVLA